MPALMPTEFFAVVTWLGVVPDRDAALASQALSDMPLSFAGYEAESHAGLTRPSCSRVIKQYRRNTDIKNTRQLSIVSQEELVLIAEKMGLDSLSPDLIGASVVIEGIPDWSHVPPASRLIAEDGPGLVVDMENRPCNRPAPVIDAQNPGAGGKFKAAAKGKRGVTAYVEKPGVLKLGDVLRLHIPDQPVWAHATKL